MKKKDVVNFSKNLAFGSKSDLFNTINKEPEEDNKNQFDLMINSYLKKTQLDMKRK